MKNFDVKGKRVYIAASYPRKAEAIILAEKYKADGALIVSQWMYIEEGYEKKYPTIADRADAMYRAATRDLNDLNIAEVLVVITGDEKTHGGRHAEFGVALGYGCRIILHGPREHVLHHCVADEFIENNCQCGAMCYDGHCLDGRRHAEYLLAANVSVIDPIAEELGSRMGEALSALQLKVEESRGIRNAEALNKILRTDCKDGYFQCEKMVDKKHTEWETLKDGGWETARWGNWC